MTFRRWWQLRKHESAKSDYYKGLKMRSAEEIHRHLEEVHKSFLHWERKGNKENADNTKKLEDLLKWVLNVE